MKNKNNYLIGLLFAALIAWGVWGALQSSGPPGQYDTFASCLKDKGAVFYGAFWCPHCQNQKKMFGTSEKLLPYVECSTPDGRGKTPFCTSKKIEGYPTWEFADGSRLSGEVELTKLAEKTGCELPQQKAIGDK